MSPFLYNIQFPQNNRFGFFFWERSTVMPANCVCVCGGGMSKDADTDNAEEGGGPHLKF